MNSSLLRSIAIGILILFSEVAIAQDIVQSKGLSVRVVASIPSSLYTEGSVSLRLTLRTSECESIKHILFALVDNSGCIHTCRPADASGTVVFDQIDSRTEWTLATFSPFTIQLLSYHWELPLQHEKAPDHLEMPDLVQILNLQTGKVIADRPVTLQSLDGTELRKMHTNNDGLVIFEPISSNRTFKVSIEGVAEPDLFIIHMREMRTIPLQRPSI